MSAFSDLYSAALADLTDPPCIAAARRFDPRRHRRLMIAATAVGWIREDDVDVLRRWPAVFTIAPGTVTLAAALDTLEARSAALGGVIQALAGEGRITGWRDETFAIRNRFDDPPLAFIERAASRFFGTMTYAVHVNGLLGSAADGGGGRGSHRSKDKDDGNDGNDGNDGSAMLWIARRSLDKAVDPGMLDTLVGGGIGWGWGIEAALEKECWEESGIAPELVRTARPGRILHILTEIPQGTQAEQLFTYDLWLPPDFAPHAEDGEVAEHLCVRGEEALQAVATGRMTVDASITTLDCALRHGWLDADSLPGFARLMTVPLPGREGA
ncbi:DUF4743 domain-containing protein [Robbsia sp. Bb-Pol-6]|uniref:DUF4743 domain-containing protein n=1 Tax=Robbsia betulipollinis TaxID=2981849 RepID=A0ABT3ZKZ0_9BURK|nr:DUF4743 domain-containing protein [Robbsia betulipollinis]MCY0387194.1 DUF4743 domain-containing protein [Robbsia betulipollinis]